MRCTSLGGSQIYLVILVIISVARCNVSCQMVKWSKAAKTVVSIGNLVLAIFQNQVNVKMFLP